MRLTIRTLPRVVSVGLTLLSVLSANTSTQTSPGIGPLPEAFSAMGGIVIDMVGANGKRLTAQISPSKLPVGAAGENHFFPIWTQTGFDSYSLQTLLGGGLQRVNVRLTLMDGDSAGPNPVYVAMYGAGNFLYRNLDSRQPGDYDFDAGTDLYFAISLNGGGFINLGYMGQTTTYRLDASGNTVGTFTGWPGVYALTLPEGFTPPKPPQYMPPFAVTGWFTVPSTQLTALYNTLTATGSMTLGIWDIDPGDQVYDFTQGTGGDITDIPLIPPTIISFTATPNTIVGSGTVTLSWQVTAATAVSIDHGVGINPTQFSGSTTVPVSATTTFTLTASAPGGVATAAATVTALPPLAITTGSLPPGIAGTAYAQTLAASGGTSPYRWSVSSGTLPPGLSLSTAGLLSGTPTTAGTSTFVIQATDSSIPAQAATAAYTLTINPGLSITTPALPGAVSGAPYTQSLSAAGGTAPYTWSLASGSLPPGLTLGADGTISGTPTATGSTTFTIRATDSTTPAPQTVTQTYSITVGAHLAIQTTSLATGVVGSAYIQSLAAIGGTPPYAWSVESGPLPPGLTLASIGSISGTPSAAGLTTIVVRVTDSTSPTAQTATQTLTIYIVDRLTIDTAAFPDGTAAHPYAQAIAARNGTPPYVWSLASGSLPPGIALLASGALIGTPNIAGTYQFSLKVTDSTVPNTQSATRDYELTIHPAFTILTTALPGASAGVPYSAGIAATDGTTPYAFAVVFGALPPGLTLLPLGIISGTPTKPGIYNMLIRATDSSNPPQTSDQPLTITVDSSLSITTPNLPDATQGISYTQTLAAINGLQPYTWSVTGGTLPDGLNLLLSGTIVGTPTKPGTYHFTVQATDSDNPTPAISTRSYSLTVNTPLTITTASLPNGLIDIPYVAILTTTGGQPQYTYSLTDGTMPPGLNISPIGVISGTPTAAGTYSFTIQVADSSATPSAIQTSFTIAINQPLFITIPTSLPSATLDAIYTLQLTATGGIQPYHWSTTSHLPTGLQLLSPGILIGTPTTAGTFPLTIAVTDATSPAPQMVSADVLLTVTARLTIPNNPLPTILPSVPYSAAVQATGGVPPYTWSLVAGSLPDGLSINPEGTVSGITATPSAAYNIELRVTDSANNVATQEFVLLVGTPFAITSTSPLQALLGRPYSHSLAITGGQSPYTCSLAAGNLPADLTLASDGTISGIPTTAGTYNFVTQCRDAASQTAIKPLSLIVQTPLGIIATALPPAVTKMVYYHLFQASDGTPPFRWSIQNGTLPDGLVLTDAGLLTGTASTTGTFPLTISVTDNSTPTPQTATTQVSLSVTQALTPLPQRLDATTATHVSQPLIATGGAPPYAWAIAAGSLPSGLSLAPDGTISGTPTTAGMYPLVISVTDSNGLVATALFPVTITAQLSIPLPSTAIPAAVAGQPYAAVISAMGGAAPYSWEITTGSLPAGITLNSAGILSGTPTTTGDFPFTAIVTDSTGQTGTKQYTLHVQPRTANPTIPASSAALPLAIASRSYAAPLVVNGGSGPYTWALASGSTLPNGLSLVGAAIIGTPATAGTYTFALTVSDASGLTSSSPYVLTVCSPLTVSTTSLPNAAAGLAYSAAFTATGGVPPYTWSGTVPDGLSLSTAGVISGTPSTAGTLSITVTVTDASTPPITAIQPLSLNVTSPLIIATTNPPTLSVGSLATITLQARGGTQPYSWSISSGTLPPGLILNSNGTISGTPTKAGAYLVTVALRDTTAPTPLTTSSQILLTIVDSLTITTGSLPNAAIGTPYAATLQAQGGTPPYSWSISSGTLPSGLTLNGGSITGTPATSATANLIIQVADINGKAATRALTLTVSASLTITTTTLPNSPARASFSYTLHAAGGTPPYAWSLASGSLPPGITLAAGVLSGTPTTTGTFTFVAKASDASVPQQTATAQLSLTIDNNLAITTNSLPPATISVLYRVQLTAAGGTPPYSWRASAGLLPVGLTLTTAGVLTGTPANPAVNYNFVVQVTDSQQQTATASFTLAVSDAPTLSLQLFPSTPILDPLTQAAVHLTLESPYPSTLTGQIVISGTQDPDVTFIQDGTKSLTLPFTIPAGVTSATFSAGAALLQSGTSSQPFTVTATTDSPLQTAMQQYSLLPLPPQITKAHYLRTDTGFEISIEGFSTTREVQTATFRFSAANGAASAPYTMSVSDIFHTWFHSAASAGSGTFLYRQAFNLSGLGTANLTSAEVTLSNSVGTSSPITVEAQ